MSLEKISTSFSIRDYEEMFVGAIVGGVIDGNYLAKIKIDVITTPIVKTLFGIITKIMEKNGWVDYLSVLELLKVEKGINESKTYLDLIISKVPAEFNPAKAIEILEGAYVKRNAIEMLKKAELLINEDPKMAAEISYQLYEKIESLSDIKVTYDIKKEFTETAEDVIAGRNDKLVIKTGMNSIDIAIGGISKEEITIVGSRPGHGKSSLAVALPLSICRVNPTARVNVFQLEMAKEQFKRKFLANVSNVSSYRMRINQLQEGDAEKIATGVQYITQFSDRLFIYDNVFDLFTMNKINRATKADVAIMDFITLTEDFDDSNPRMSIARIAKATKRFAKAHHMAWIIMSQLNRGQEIREGHLPNSGDLAESDTLTQLASEIILLYYKYKYTNAPADQKMLKLIYDKARYSSIKDINMYFDADLSIIKDKS